MTKAEHLDQRLDTRRRKTIEKPCMVCADTTQFEYFMNPPSPLRHRALPQRWCPLCLPCLDYWLDEGVHRNPPTTNPHPSCCSSTNRPFTQNEREAFAASKLGTLNSRTGLLTLDWRRGPK